MADTERIVPTSSFMIASGHRTGVPALDAIRSDINKAMKKQERFAAEAKADGNVTSGVHASAAGAHEDGNGNGNGNGDGKDNGKGKGPKGDKVTEVRTDIASSLALDYIRSLHRALMTPREGEVLSGMRTGEASSSTTATTTTATLSSSSASATAVSRSAKARHAVALRDEAVAAAPVGTVLYSGSFLSVWNGIPSADGMNVCFVRIPSFMPNPISDAGVEAALSDIENGIDTLSRRKCDKVVIDLMTNGGGMICLGYRLMSQLIPSFSLVSDGKYDIIHAKWVEELLKYGRIGGFTNQDFFSPTTGGPFWDMSWYNNGPTRVRGGKTSQYSIKTLLPCSDVRQLRTPALFYPASRIAVVADGQCGSTCELVFQKLQNVAHVRSAAVGGIWGNDMDASSFGGGNVLSANDILMSLRGYRENIPSLPPNFFTSAQMSFNWREMYSFVEPKSILEWEFFPAQTRIPHWPVLNLDPEQPDFDLYAKLASSTELFDGRSTCEPGTAVPCRLPDKIGAVQPCSGGVISQDECSSYYPSRNGGGGNGLPTYEPRPKANYSLLSFAIITSVFAFAIVILALVAICYSRRRKNTPASTEGPEDTYTAMRD